MKKVILIALLVIVLLTIVLIIIGNPFISNLIQNTPTVNDLKLTLSEEFILFS